MSTHSIPVTPAELIHLNNLARRARAANAPVVWTHTFTLTGQTFDIDLLSV